MNPFWLSPRKLKKLSLSITNSIAFYPALIGLGILLLAPLCMSFDARYDFQEALEVIPFLKIKNPDTARSALGALISGLITLMVFSFTMVMVVLNITSTNYSPRVLPGLISKRANQIVLGIYLGAIAYTLTVLTNIDSQFYPFVVPRLAFLLNALLALLAFSCFIYFIHDISQSIQVGNILASIYRNSRRVLLKEIKEGDYRLNWQDRHGDIEWHIRAYPEPGYFDTIVVHKLQHFCKVHDLIVKMLVIKGDYLLEHEAFVALSKPLDNDALDALWNCFVFQNREIVQRNYIYGFKQITEIALKALSPAVNDPFTAVMALDHLSDLFMQLFRLPGNKVLSDNTGKPFLIFKETPIEETLHLCIAEIQLYGKNDLTVMLKIYKLLNHLYSRFTQGERGRILRNQLNDFERVLTESNFSEHDRKLFEEAAKNQSKEQ